ncbi:SRPBCC family protein [Antrihabitans sp. YC2-6]|uniref:SRPBCC family protein n=1 Tax=Antrihabitans sp. YC2-6 TaxID=2799498 RepID=UPI0018F32C97|nr:SRPBCC family protein [Antrihabitans sp. YC2-6]MBJ8346174.1 SRPBCC family protein [Antrihabitans sp. YC2-6]
MVHIHHKGEAAVPQQYLFDYVSDFRNATEWLFGITKLELKSEIEYGLGTVYEGGMKLGPKTLGAVFNMDRFEPPNVFHFDYVSGFEVRSLWEFRAIGDEVSELELNLEYVLPGGMAGRALGKIIEPFVAIAVRHSDNTLRKKIEAKYAASKTA